MGIYDREYYRRSGPSYLGTVMEAGAVTKWLVIINVAVYILQLITVRGGGGIDHYGFVTNFLAMKPDRVFFHFEIWRPLTGMFLHSPDNWFHLLFNMLLLWFFGRSIELLYGAREYLAFYLVSGVIGNLFWGVTAVAQQIQHGGMYPWALGASGAVVAVLILCALHYPQRIVYLFFVIPVPLWLVAVLVVGGDLFYFLRGVNIGVAVAAHLGGAGFAFLYKQLNWRILSAWQTVRRWFSRSRSPRLRVYTERDSSPVRTSVRSIADEQLEAKADAILEKISRLGPESLTDEERDVLQRASEQLRRRLK